MPPALTPDICRVPFTPGVVAFPSADAVDFGRKGARPLPRSTGLSPSLFSDGSDAFTSVAGGPPSSPSFLPMGDGISSSPAVRGVPASSRAGGENVAAGEKTSSYGVQAVLVEDESAASPPGLFRVCFDGSFLSLGG